MENRSQQKGPGPGRTHGSGRVLTPGPPLAEDLFQNPHVIDKKTEAEGGGQRAGLKPLYTDVLPQPRGSGGVPRLFFKALHEFLACSQDGKHRALS